VVPAVTVAAVAVASVAAVTDVLVRHLWHGCGGWPRNVAAATDALARHWWHGCGGWPRTVGAEAGPRHPAWLLHRPMRELPPLPKLSNGCAGVPTQRLALHNTPRSQRVTLNLLHADGLGEVKGAPADGGWPRIPR